MAACECGCGSVPKRGRWLKNHWKRRHGNSAAFDPVDAKAFERLHRVYGLSRTGYQSMLASQGGCCAICMDDAPGGGRRMWCVDHDHATGEVRGLLCVRCNAGLGHFRDNPRLLAYAIEYLRRK